MINGDEVATESVEAGSLLINSELRYSSSETAALLNVTVNCLRQWRFHGRGPTYYKIGGRAQYRGEDLIAFLDNARRDPNK